MIMRQEKAGTQVLILRFLTKRLHRLRLQSTHREKAVTSVTMRAVQDWETVSKSMEGVLEQEAKERALNRDAIAALRRCGETTQLSSTHT